MCCCICTKLSRSGCLACAARRARRIHCRITRHGLRSRKQAARVQDVTTAQTRTHGPDSPPAPSSVSADQAFTSPLHTHTSPFCRPLKILLRRLPCASGRTGAPVSAPTSPGLRPTTGVSASAGAGFDPAAAPLPEMVRISVAPRPPLCCCAFESVAAGVACGWTRASTRWWKVLASLDAQRQGQMLRKRPRKEGETHFMRRTSLKTKPTVTSLLLPSLPTVSSALSLSTTSSSTTGACTSKT